MNVYIYSAALLCEPCGLERQRVLDTDCDNADTGDSDDYPQGPHTHGGGEADCPQHCDSCNVFLENPLTSDGYEYVANAIVEALRSPRTPTAESIAITEWAPFYGLDNLGKLAETYRGGV